MRRKKEVTMQYIADQFNISKVTVSKALKNQDGVSEELRQNIKEVAQDLGYKLPGEDSLSVPYKNIAIMVQEKYVDVKEYTTFYLRFYQKLASALMKKGYMCTLFPLGEKIQNSAEIMKLFSDSGISGVMVLGDVKKHHTQIIKELSIPMIFVDCYNGDLNIDCIVTDNYYSSYEITKYLIKNGHKDIAFVGNINATSSIQDRYLGYCRALMGAGIKVEGFYVIPDRDENNEEIPFEIPEQLPTAFVCNCDDTAYKFVTHLKEQGYKVPQDVSVVGFDNDIYAELSRPKLTTVAVDLETMTEKAAHLMIHKIEHQVPSKQSKVFVTGEIIYRDSVQKI